MTKYRCLGCDDFVKYGLCVHTLLLEEGLSTSLAFSALGALRALIIPIVGLPYTVDPPCILFRYRSQSSGEFEAVFSCNTPSSQRETRRAFVCYEWSSTEGHQWSCSVHNAKSCEHVERSKESWDDLREQLEIASSVPKAGPDKGNQKTIDNLLHVRQDGSSRMLS